MTLLLPLAMQMLAKHREFYPFGAYEGNERPKSKVLIEMMVGALRKDAPAKG